VQAIKNSLGWVKDGAETVGGVLVDCGKGLAQAGKDIWNDPGLILGTVKNSGDMIWTGVKTTVTDPQKAWDFVKDAVGINNIINSWDPNRGLLDRLGQVGIAVFKGYTTIQTAGQAGALIKAGGSKILGVAEGLIGKAGVKTAAGVGTKAVLTAGGKAATGAHAAEYCYDQRGTYAVRKVRNWSTTSHRNRIYRLERAKEFTL